MWLLWCCCLGMGLVLDCLVGSLLELCVLLVLVVFGLDVWCVLGFVGVGVICFICFLGYS